MAWEQSASVDSIKDLIQNSHKVTEYERHAKKAGGYNLDMESCLYSLICNEMFQLTVSKFNGLVANRI